MQKTYIKNMCFNKKYVKQNARLMVFNVDSKFNNDVTD